MAKIVPQLLDIKKALYFLMMLFMLSACTESNSQEAKTEVQTTDAAAQQVSSIAYTEYPLAYLVDGELFFYSLADNKKVKFIEEPSAIFNFTFDTEGTTLYYNVERDNTLWLKSADISTADVTPQWLVDWQLQKDECITETYDETSPLLYHQGKLLMQHGFNWDNYYFSSMSIYSIGTKEISRKGLDYDVIQKYSGALTFDKIYQYFKTIKQQLYYTGNNAKVCLTDKLDFVAQKTEGDEVDEIEFTGFMLSPDKTKILFGAAVSWGDLGHGPYNIANADGSQQMMLKDTDIASSKQPVWLKNNRVVFIDNENNLFIANNDENTIEKVAENVSSYVAH